MKDELIIADALHGAVRLHAARTTELVNTAVQIHHCLPTSAAALGRVLTVAGLMASDLKQPEEHVDIRLDGKGPCGIIRAQADGAGHVRGLIANPLVHVLRKDGHLDVGQGVGHDGFLQVRKDLGLKEPFTGIVPLQTGEIGDDFAYYYAVSEQIPSVVAVGVLVEKDYSIKAAGGILMQMLPGAPEEAVRAVETVTRTMKPMTFYMAQDRSVSEILTELFPDAEIFAHRPIAWHCGCSRENFAAALATLKENDLKAMIQEDHGAEIRCDYCQKVYTFSEDELKSILESRRRHA
jgi:molecular chaperone Hsp33